MGFSVVFLGGRQAGCIGLLTVCAASCEVLGVVAYDDRLRMLAEAMGLQHFGSIHEPSVQELLSRSDLLVSVHGRERVPEELLRLPRCGGINAHPCLSWYKGMHPIERLLQDGRARASVGVHRMTARLDEGTVLAEEFVDVSGSSTVEEVYNALYPFYAIALLRALGAVRIPI